jgi:hypothetical protein
MKYHLFLHDTAQGIEIFYKIEMFIIYIFVTVLAAKLNRYCNLQSVRQNPSLFIIPCNTHSNAFHKHYIHFTDTWQEPHKTIPVAEGSV